MPCRQQPIPWFIVYKLVFGSYCLLICYRGLIRLFIFFGNGTPENMPGYHGSFFGRTESAHWKGEIRLRQQNFQAIQRCPNRYSICKYLFHGLLEITFELM